MYVMKGWVRGEYVENYFTAGERDLAIQVTQRTQARGSRVSLYFKDAVGNFQFVSLKRQAA